MNVELLTFGDELLDGRRIDTNTAWLGRQFTSLGVPPLYRQSTTDRMEDVVAAFRLACTRSKIILSTGGLGPTSDDLTFEALAKSLDRPLVFHPEIFEVIQERFKQKGLVCPESNRRQAMLPQGATPLPNDWGTAPGVWIEEGRRVLICLPGVPSEMKNIFSNTVLAKLEKIIGEGRRRSEKIYTFVGMGESLLEEAVDRCHLTELRGGDVRIAYTASFPAVDVTLSVASNDKTSLDRILSEADQRLKGELGKYLVVENGESLEEKVVRVFTAAGKSLAIAESFTGGMVASKIIDVSGSSSVFERGWVTYSNRSKVEQLGVSSDTLTRVGAVSEACAVEMALGAKRQSGADFALATTGIAGPSGATDQKRVGLAYIACVGPKFEKSDTYVEEFHFRWDRNRNRLIAVYESLKMLLRVFSRESPTK